MPGACTCTCIVQLTHFEITVRECLWEDLHENTVPTPSVHRPCKHNSYLSFNDPVAWSFLDVSEFSAEDQVGSQLIN